MGCWYRGVDKLGQLLSGYLGFIGGCTLVPLDDAAQLAIHHYQV